MKLRRTKSVAVLGATLYVRSTWNVINDVFHLLTISES